MSAPANDRTPVGARDRAVAPTSRRPGVLVHDVNQDALLRRAAAARTIAEGLGWPVHATSSLTGARLLARGLPEGSVALVDLFDGDRQGVERIGVQVIAACARAGLRTYAWTAHSTPDALHGASIAGAIGAVPVLPQESEAAALRAAIVGEVSVALAPAAFPAGDAPWADWFFDEFGKPWEPRMEPALARLAETGERTVLADQLAATGAASDRAHGTRLLRDLAKLIAGERDRVPGYVAAKALEVLTVIAGYRPLVDRPAAVASLERAAADLEREPSLGVAAGVPPEAIDEVREVWRLIVGKRDRSPKSVGAPGSGVADGELAWALRHRIADLRLDADDAERLVAGITTRVQATCIAVADARLDALYHPAPRLASALLAGADLPAGELPRGVEPGPGGLRWHGAAPFDVITATQIDPRDAADATRSIDAALAGR